MWLLLKLYVGNWCVRITTIFFFLIGDLYNENTWIYLLRQLLLPEQELAQLLTEFSNSPTVESSSENTSKVLCCFSSKFLCCFSSLFQSHNKLNWAVPQDMFKGCLCVPLWHQRFHSANCQNKSQTFPAAKQPFSKKKGQGETLHLSLDKKCPFPEPDTNFVAT